ncbi:hypothetical protein Nocox_20080 [Nonomuraea coxensis DSM 45129]|uniref:Uncharacterized protein n=1 Tax=Nonomuraea coxensis DSM 45129 TaxID=1122611 RepID=A0ABX8U1P6_9ACTN|nr:hypothetical protein [Nonomuraea coxensis]QYC41625.1 hypothetical protein Nocox_20080 [Nonomuraea coxensis DSM 45129]
MSARSSDLGTSSTAGSASRLAHRLLALGTVLVTAAGLLVAHPSAATAADTTTDLGVSAGRSDIAATDDRLFISAEDRVIVADHEARLTGAVTGLPSVGDLALTSDGTRLYATLRDTHQIAEIDTGSLTVTRRIAMNAYPCPSRLALLGTRLYVGYGCGPDWSAGVVGFDVSAPEPEFARLPQQLYAAPLVAAAGQKLIVGETALSPGDLFVYDLAETGPVLRGVISGSTHRLFNLTDLAISADGSTAFSAFGAPYRFDAWDTGDLTLVRSYGEGSTFTGYPKAVTVSADGRHVIGGRTAGKPVVMYDSASGEQTFAYENLSSELVAGSLAYAGGTVFGVLRDLSGRLHLVRLPDVTLPGSAITLTAPATGTALTPLTLSGKLTLSDGSAPGEQPLTLIRWTADGARTPVPGVTTAADGTYAVEDTPPIGGQIRYDVLWDGDADHRWSRAWRDVRVAKVSTLISLTPAAPATALEPLTLSGTLTLADGADPGEQPLVVTRLTANGTRETLPAVTTATDGTFTIDDTPPIGGNTQYDVRWSGNLTYEAATGLKTVAVARRRTTLTLSGPGTGHAGKQLEFSGALDGGGRLPGAGTAITVTRTVSGRTGTSTTTLPPAALSADGTFGFTDTPPEGGDHTYTVRYAGDSVFLAAEGTHEVTVRGQAG